MASGEAPKKRNYKHWRMFSDESVSYSKLTKRREAGLCIGCGKSPCECKHPRSSRKK